MSKLSFSLAKMYGLTQVNYWFKTNTTLFQYIGIKLKQKSMAFLTSNSNEKVLTHFLLFVQIGTGRFFYGCLYDVQDNIKVKHGNSKKSQYLFLNKIFFILNLHHSFLK